MKKFIFIPFLITSLFSHSQEIDNDLNLAKKQLSSLNFEIDSLNAIKNTLKKKIDSIELSLFDLDSDYIIRWDWKVTKAGEKCKVVTPGEKWTIVNTLKIKNYKVPTFYLVKEQKFIEIQNKDRKEEKEEVTERKSYLIKSYGSGITNKILNKEIWIGMTKKMTIESWGEPNDINKTVGDWGVHEQWIYSNIGFYLYFENGKLTSWQD